MIRRGRGLPRVIADPEFFELYVRTRTHAHTVHTRVPISPSYPPSLRASEHPCLVGEHSLPASVPGWRLRARTRPWARTSPSLGVGELPPGMAVSLPLTHELTLCFAGHQSLAWAMEMGTLHPVTSLTQGL